MKSYLKDKLIIFIWFPILGILSIYSMDSFDPIEVRIGVPAFMFAVPLLTFIYGYLKHRE